MAKVQLLIELDEDLYNFVIVDKLLVMDLPEVGDAIKNGTVLSEDDDRLSNAQEELKAELDFDNKLTPQSASWLARGDSTTTWYKCSNCGGAALQDEMHRDILSKECPHCHAIMENGECEISDSSYDEKDVEIIELQNKVKQLEQHLEIIELQNKITKLKEQLHDKEKEFEKQIESLQNKLEWREDNYDDLVKILKDHVIVMVSDDDEHPCIKFDEFEVGFDGDSYEKLNKILGLGLEDVIDRYEYNSAR